MSFDELMKKAKEQSLSKGGKQEPKAPLPPKKYGAHDSKPIDNNTPTLYHRLKRPELTKTTLTTNEQGMSARERGKLLIAEPPKKLNVQKRDRRTIADVQREIRHNKGIHSDDEDRPRSSHDPRLMNKNRTPYPNNRKRPLSPPSSQRPFKKSLPQSNTERRPPPPAVRRMPFSGKPLDGRRPLPPSNRRRHREDEEVDEDLASFIVEDEDEDDDPRYAREPRRNSYSDEISKIFRYDKSR